MFFFIIPPFYINNINCFSTNNFQKENVKVILTYLVKFNFLENVHAAGLKK